MLTISDPDGPPASRRPQRKAPGRSAGAAPPSLAELMQAIRAAMPASAKQRIQLHHAEILGTMMAMAERTPDANAIHKALLDAGHDIGMSKVYRSLKLLQETGLIRHGWLPSRGNLRGVYVVADDSAEVPVDANGCCILCGAALAPGAKRAEAGAHRP